MKFKRCEITTEPRPVTARRFAAAERAVKNEQAKYPLFPELCRWNTAKERIAAMDRSWMQWAQHYRDSKANTWRKSRQRLQELPEPCRLGVLKKWQSDGYFPRDACYLADMITQAERCYARKTSNNHLDTPSAHSRFKKTSIKLTRRERNNGIEN